MQKTASLLKSKPSVRFIIIDIILWQREEYISSLKMNCNNDSNVYSLDVVSIEKRNRGSNERNIRMLTKHSNVVNNHCVSTVIEKRTHMEETFDFIYLLYI